MSRRWFFSPIFAVLLLASSAAAFAQDGEPFRRRFSYDYVINQREHSDVTARIETDVISPSMVQTLGQHRMSVNHHIPKDVRISKPFGEYQSSYKQTGRSLQVSRKLVWRVPGKVCTREIANELREVSVAAARDFNARFRIVDVSFNGPYNDDQGSEAPD